MKVTQTIVAAAGLLLGLGANIARADAVLLNDTTLVSGSESAVFAFQAPGPGTVTVELTNVDWPQPLSSLSFMAGSANHVMSSWSESDPGSPGSANLTFQVAAGGRYFADVIAQAGGSLDLGVYSMCIKFTPPTSAVPLPASGGLLLIGIATMLALRRTLRRAPLCAEAVAG
jgi:hypothetical protein